MSRKILKGIKQVSESGLSAETGYLYLVSNESGEGYVQLDGEKYGSDEIWELGENNGAQRKTRVCLTEHTYEDSFVINGDANSLQYTLNVLDGGIDEYSHIYEIGKQICIDGKKVSTITSNNVDYGNNSCTFTVDKTLSNDPVQTSALWSFETFSGTTATGLNSHAEGKNTIAIGDGSHAEGASDRRNFKISGSGDTRTYTVIATEDFFTVGAIVEILGDFYKIVLSSYPRIVLDRTVGKTLEEVDATIYYGGTAFGDYSHVEGHNNLASGATSHAEGYKAQANGESSHAEGFDTRAGGNSSHAEGESTDASGNSSHAEGEDTTASGDCSHAEGYHTRAKGYYSHAEGFYTSASGDTSHAEGHHTTASGYYSHAEGTSTTESGYGSHAEGISTTANGIYSHAEGYNTTTSGYSSHSEGNNSNAVGDYSHAEGWTSYSYGTASHAEGTSEHRNFKISGSGDTKIYTVSATYDFFIIGAVVEVLGSFYRIDNKNYPKITLDRTIGETLEEVDATMHYGIAIGNYSHVEGQNNLASGLTSHAEGHTTRAIGNYSHAEGDYTSANGNYSHAECSNTVANGNYSHAEGHSTTAGGDYSHAEGYITRTVGTSSHSEGGNTRASGSYSHAEGYHTEAWSIGSHSEGGNTSAIGSFSHAEGNNTTASGANSHAEGVRTTANGSYSHAEGDHTHTSGEASHAEGKYNYSSSDIISCIGIGDDDNLRRNAISVGYDGLVYIKGINGYTGQDISSGNSLQNYLENYSFSTKITYSHLLSEKNANALIPGGKYVIMDYHTSCIQSGLTPLNKSISIELSALDKSTLSPNGILIKKASQIMEGHVRYLWIDDFGSEILQEEPEIIGTYAQYGKMVRYYLSAHPKKFKYLREIEFDGRTLHLWECQIDKFYESDQFNDYNKSYKYILTYDADYAGRTLVDNVANRVAPIYAVLDEDMNESRYFFEDSKETKDVFYAVEQEDYYYNPYSVTSNYIAVEKFSGGYCGEVDWSFYLNARNDVSTLAENSATAYKLLMTINYDEKTFYMWEAVTGQYGTIPSDYPQYKYMLTETADFGDNISLQDNSGSTLCPVYCFLNDDNEPYIDGDGYNTHDMLLIRAEYNTSFPEVRPIPGGSESGETDSDEYTCEIKYCIDNDTEKFGWADENGTGVIYWMRDEYGNEAPFDFKNILQRDGEFTFGSNGIDYSKHGNEYGVYGNKIHPYIVSGVQYINEVRFSMPDTYANEIKPSVENVNVDTSVSESIILMNARGELVAFNPASLFSGVVPSPIE